MQLNLFIPEITFLTGYYSGEPVPQQEELLDVLEAYPYPVFCQSGAWKQPKEIVKVIGYSKKSEVPDRCKSFIVKTAEGSIGEFCPFEMFSDVKISEVKRSWGSKPRGWMG